MADEKLSTLVELDATPAVDDEILIRDVSEPAATESKRITVANLLAGAGYSAPTRSFTVFPQFTPSNPVTARGDFAIAALNAGSHECSWSFGVPTDFGSLTTVKIIYIGRQSDGETFDYTVTTDFGAVGEAYTANSDSVTADGVTPVEDQLGVLVITDAFTGLAGGDFCGAKLLIDAVSATPEMYITALEFAYSE